MIFQVRNYVAILIFFFLTANAAHAQTGNPFVAGVGAGTFVYQGDLVPSDLGGYRALKPAVQLYAGKWVNPYFQVRATLAAGQIRANDADYTTPAWKQDRNLSFSANITELSARLVFSPLGNSILTPDRRWYPYVFAGAGVSLVNIRRNWSGIDSSFRTNEKMAAYLAADSAATLPRSLLSIPVGAGLTYALSPRWSLFAEASYHVPVTDYLDGFSYLGNSKKNDNYYMLSLGANMTLFKNRFMRCPTNMR